MDRADAWGFCATHICGRVTFIERSEILGGSEAVTSAQASAAYVEFHLFRAAVPLIT
jgi:hypothetical protein